MQGFNPIPVEGYNLKNNPEIKFEKTTKDEIQLDILYDNTLIKHDDGHITGRIQNNGDKTIYYPKIYAVVHGYELVLDITQNIEFIEKIEGNINNVTFNEWHSIFLEQIKLTFKRGTVMQYDGDLKKWLPENSDR